LPTRMVSIQSSKYPPDKLNFALSLCEIPIVGRIHNNAFIIDVRTLLDDDIDYIVQAFQELHV
ncbi:L-seryl-tRNA(Sec) selenium transferase, partial [bacterium AH-315-P07]|nr:L-seryl-tRNA(Sec) selenium transferase [bacterium AH-315-P07]